MKSSSHIVHAVEKGSTEKVPLSVFPTSMLITLQLAPVIVGTLGDVPIPVIILTLWFELLLPRIVLPFPVVKLLLKVLIRLLLFLFRVPLVLEQGRIQTPFGLARDGTKSDAGRRGRPRRTYFFALIAAGI